MQLHRLRLTNFRQHADTEIVLGLGLTAIIGPNGSGKTTLLEAIAWALYGAQAARGTKESIRWNGAAPRSQVRVELSLSLGAHEYRVVRGLYQAELYQDGGDKPIASSHQEVTSRVIRLLGMTLSEFFNTYFTGQKELAIMASLTPSERAKFLSRLLGYEKLKDVQDQLREGRSVLRGELTATERSLGDEGALREELGRAKRELDASRTRHEEAQRARTTAERELTEVGPEWNRLVALREQVTASQSNLKLARQAVEEGRRECMRVDKELATALRARDELEELEDVLREVDPLRVELEALDAEAKRAGKRRSLMGKLEEVSAETDRLTNRVRVLENAESELERAREQAREAEKRLVLVQDEEAKNRTAWIRDRQDADTKLASFRDQYGDLNRQRKRVEELGPDGTCPTCSRVLGDEHARVLASLNTQMEEIESTGKFFRQRFEQLKKEPEEMVLVVAQRKQLAGAADKARALVGACEARVRECGDLVKELDARMEHKINLEKELAALPDRYDANRHDSVRANLKGLEPTVQAAMRSRVKAEQVEGLVKEVDGAGRNLSEKEEIVARLTDKIESMGFSETEFEVVAKRYEDAQLRARRRELEIAGLEGDLKATEAMVRGFEQKTEELATNVRRLKDIKKELRVAEVLDSAIRDLRTELNASMRPELSEIASSFLAELTEDRYHELALDEDYNVRIVEDGVEKSVISGGEEDVANLALRLAVSQMVAERSGHPLSLLVLDEIFGSLDEVKRENVIELLRRLRDRFPQVVLISHIESVRDGADRVLRVRFNEGTGASVVTEGSGSDGNQDLAA
ncbi:MAG: SMC family ATPase [Gemmatimonadales bacterium]